MDNALSSLAAQPDTDAMRSAMSLAADPKATHGKTVDAVARDFESMFLSQMLQPMWAGLDADGEFDGGPAEETFRSLLVNEYAKNISKAGGLGFAATVKTELLRLQEGHHA